MNCVLCKNGETSSGVVTVTLQRRGTTIITKGVPAEVCNNCCEYYLDDDTTNRLLSKANKAVEDKAEIEIVQFAA